MLALAVIVCHRALQQAKCARSRPGLVPGFVMSEAVSPVWPNPPVRSRRTVEREIRETAGHRDDANRHLDFDAYQHLTEQLDDLLEELRTFPTQRRPT